MAVISVMTLLSELRKGKATGAVVQLVRISACHAGGREFESRRHRKKIALRNQGYFFVCLCQKKYEGQMYDVRSIYEGNIQV